VVSTLRSGLIAVLALLILTPGAAVARRSADSRPGAACGGASASAINQYCEDIPAATGPSAPGPGTRALAGALPAPLVHALATGSPGQGSGAGGGSASAGAGGRASAGGTTPNAATAHQLLLLPAPARRLPLIANTPATVDGSSLFTGLIIALAALGALVGLCGLAAARHRRRAA
jgi:hypothetical protein